MEFDIASARLENQLLIETRFKTPKAVVSHFGAMQAQDFAMSKWAVGSRLPDSTDESIQNAIDDGDIIRTHVLRPTWHLAASEDIGWMIDLTKTSILRQFASVNKKLGLDEKIFSKSTDLIAKSLEGNNHLTREKINEILRQNGIKTNEYRSLHILAHAELHRVVCSGKRIGKHHSYALFDERVKNAKFLEKDEALAELASRYFSSHAPATLRDFVWWSGLSVSDSRRAIDLNGKKLVSREIDGQIYLAENFENAREQPSVFLLPAFDEFLIAYKSRTASIAVEHSPKAFTGNGIFKPIVVVNGQVIGTWKRTVKKEKLLIEFSFFGKKPATVKNKILREAGRFAEFVGLGAEIKF